MEIISSVKNNKILVGESISNIRIYKQSYGHINFSNINIWVSKDKVLSTYKKYISKHTGKFIYIKANLYGLGGRLSVIASALGFVDKQSIYKVVCIDKDSAINISFPLPIEENDKLKQKTEQSTPKGLYDKIFDTSSNYKTEQILSHHKTPLFNSLVEQDREYLLITRDFINELRVQDEGLLQCKRRLYERIMPSDRVNNRINTIQEKFNLASFYDKALAVHVRHGNGERYYSKIKNKWGVKPPSRDEVIRSISYAIKESTIEIECIVLASDCQAVNSVVSDYFSKDYNVFFISSTVQDIGAGCNHNEFLFDSSVVRKEVDDELEEINTFSEIIILSKCAVICGGSSYFFEAVQGFSKCKEEDIFSIDNSDRYVEVKPVEKTIDEIGAKKLSKSPFLIKMREKNILIDGLFLETLNNGMVNITYFNEVLFTGTFLDFDKDFDMFYEKIRSFRIY
ncbi:hypothetical protein [Psychrobacter immobilis]|uniref:hypothetical protein n=1 Tax=Psychrobacter immobilis TaxID=498 RepID=UPI001917D6EF|nr:hypothetical protein [Psychrobacter immobilis]